LLATIFQILVAKPVALRHCSSRFSFWSEQANSPYLPAMRDHAIYFLSLINAICCSERTCLLLIFRFI